MAAPWPRDMEVWAEGFQCTSRRWLSPAERATVRRRAWRLRASLAAAVLAFPVILFTALLAMVFIGEVQGIARGGVILLVLLLCSCCGFIVFAGRNWLEEGRAIGRDVRLGYVERFDVAARMGDGKPLVFRGLREAGWSDERIQQIEWFELLPGSGLFWRVNEVWPGRWIPTVRTEFAATPAYAVVAAEWLEPLHGSEGEVHTGNRELTAAEAGELRRHMRRLALEPLKGAFPCSIWLGALLWLHVRADSPKTPSEPIWSIVPQLTLLVATTLVFDVWLLCRLYRVTKHLRDIHVGRVLITRCPLMESDEELTSPPLSATIEILPFSGIEWTIDQRPAEWRIR